jgi:hypothetical protein
MFDEIDNEILDSGSPDAAMDGNVTRTLTATEKVLLSKNLPLDTVIAIRPPNSNAN